MSDENNEATINQKAQLSEEALKKVVGGFESQEHGAATPTTSHFSISYEQIQYQYYTQD